MKCITAVIVPFKNSSFVGNLEFYSFNTENMKLIIEEKPKYTSHEAETKNWVYDLIKGEQEVVFVAEVPGPEDKIMVRLVEGILYIRGSNHFSKEVPIEGSQDMQIVDFKYRNGVLTLRIKKS